MQRDNDLAGRYQQLHDVFNAGEVGAKDELSSRDGGALGIGTDPREWWVANEIRQAFTTQAAEMHAANMRFHAGDIQAFSEGTVGWIADRPTLKTGDGGEVPMRLTAVCHQEDGKWKLVQFHLSLGVGSEQSIGEELTV